MASPSTFNTEDVVRYLATKGESGRLVLKTGKTMPLVERRTYYGYAAAHFHRLRSEADLYRWLPVDVHTFIESPYFLNQKGIVYPKVMEHLIELNSGKYVEAVLTGSIGTGKTTVALFTTAYQLYWLSCYRDPHEIFDLDPSSEILFVFQSMSQQLAKGVDFNRFHALVSQCPYFRERYPFDPELKSELRFPRRLSVKPLSGSTNAAIGQNVFGGLIDEMNFMQVVEKSKLAADGGVFDQAAEMYNAIVRRRKSRFMKKGRLPGMLCLVSSKRYPGEFTDRKVAEAATEKKSTGQTSIYVYDPKLWEIKPEGTFSGEWLKLFLGDIARKPRILSDDDQVPVEDQHLVMEIPVEFRSEFERDILSAIRDIAGVPTFAVNPFIVNTDLVAKCFGKRPSILSLGDCDFVTSRPQIYVDLIEKPEEPRFAHVDLSLTNNSTGVCVGWVPGFTRIERGDAGYETLPMINIDLMLEIRPPRGGEIEFENVRRLFYKLREAGMNLTWITFDTFQSRDSIQILRQKGFMCDQQSIDADAIPYEMTKTALYDGRISAPKQERALKEVICLERDPIKGTIAHPPNGSKDCADAVAGVVYGLTMRRNIWLRHKIPTTEVPRSLHFKGVAPIQPPARSRVRSIQVG